MKTYLQRYSQKNSQQLTRYWHQESKIVWSELVSLGKQIREEYLYTDAKDVAFAMMHRARQNVEIIIYRLNELGYRFSDPDRVWIQPSQEITINLDYIEHHQGTLPLALRAWFEVVGSVSLTGYYPKLSSYFFSDTNQKDQLECYSDPLVIESYDLLYGDLLPPYSIDMYSFEIAPDMAHKAAESGGGSTSLIIPNPAFDGPLIDTGGEWNNSWTGVFLIPYLQTCFDWGGFPGLRFLPEAQRPVAELAFLTKDLLPLI